MTGAYQLPLDPSVGKVSLSATFTHIDKQRSNYSDDFPTHTIGLSGFGVVQVVPMPDDIRMLGFLTHRNLFDLNLN